MGIFEYLFGGVRRGTVSLTAHQATCDELKRAWAESAELIQTLSDWTLHDQKQKEEIADLKERISKAQDALDGVDEWDVDDSVILAGDAD